MGARGHWYEKIFMDYPKKPRSEHGPVSHSFMVILDCHYPLIGRDLLTKTGAKIHFSPEGVNVMDLAGRPVQDLTMQMSTDYTKAPPK